MPINKIHAGPKGDPLNSTGSDVADTVNALVDQGDKAQVEERLERFTTLDLNYGVNDHRILDQAGLERKALSAIATTTRTSTAGRFNAFGMYEQVAANIPRIQYHPVTGECLGYLSEPAATNLAKYRRDFANAYWSKSRINITSNAAVGVDGTAAMDKVIATDVNGDHALFNGEVISAGSTLTSSFDVKSAEYTKARIGVYNSSFSEGGRVDFDMVTKTFSNPVGAGITYRYEEGGNGVFRLYASMTLPTATTGRAALYLLDNTGSAVFTGDNVSGIYADFAQQELNRGGTSRIDDPAAPASTVTRLADVQTLSGAEFTKVRNPNEGSIYCEFVMPVAIPAQVFLFSLSDGTNNSRIQVLINTNLQRLETRYITASGVGAAAGTSVTISAGTPVKLVATWKAGSQEWYFNGINFYSSTFAGVPIITRLGVGINAAGTGEQPITTISNTTIFNRALSATEATLLTGATL